MNRILRPAGGVPRPSGYSDGVEARGRIIFVAGQIATAGGGVAAGDLPAQVQQALRNVMAVLSAGGASAAHVVRMTWFVIDMDEYRRERSRIGEAYRAVMGNHYPAMTLVAVTALVDPAARVEIEATAVVPDDARE